MRKFMTTLALAGVLTGLAAAPALYAQEPQGPAQRPDGSMMSPDMQSMMKMMEMCGKMMQGRMQGGMMGDPGSRKPDTK